MWLLGRVISLPPLYVIYSELNRHGISRKRENADDKILRVDMTNGYAYTESEARRSFQLQASIHAAKGWSA